MEPDDHVEGYVGERGEEVILTNLAARAPALRREYSPDMQNSGCRASASLARS
jgi:hypothetical protein